MKVTLNWLRELVAVGLDTAALCERLIMGGIGVDGVEEIGAEIRDVVVGEIVSMAPHPHADHLTLCQVRAGDEAPVPVVCGATNMKAGDRVAFARPGATLPGGRRIEAAVIRGVTSMGMLCSEAELGLSERAEGILILAPDAPLGVRVGAHLGIEDTVLDLDVTPNRGDCLSVLGIAREVAALTGARLLRQRIAVRERGLPAHQAVSVRIEDVDGCARYAARIVRNVTVGPSPDWMQRRLLAVGMRPINNVVDVTNYVMIERGQPLHAFDHERLPRPEIVVRRAGQTRTIRTLDGVMRELAPDDLLITTGEQPVAIAGVMGGADSEVVETTRHVLLESAWFNPSAVRRTSRRLDLRSQASYRFERCTDIEGVVPAIDRAAMLLERLAGGEVAPGTIEAYPGAKLPAPIHVRLKRIEDILGVTIARNEVVGTLKALGASVSAGPKGSIAAVPPSYRSDLSREIDIIEEVARVIGYQRIPASMPSAGVDAGRIPERMVWAAELRRLLAACGLSEAICLGFVPPRMNEIFRGFGFEGTPVQVLNPLSRQESQMRLSLLPGLIGVWRTNRSQGAERIAYFSFGKVYWKTASAQEAWRLGGVLAGLAPSTGLGANREVDFADAKGVVEMLLERLHVERQASWIPIGEHGALHPGKSCVVQIAGTPVGILGCLHPEVESEIDAAGAHWFFELDLEKLLSYVPRRLHFRELPRFPAVVRDLAVIADEDFASDQVPRFVLERHGDLVEDVVLFDLYRGAPIPPQKKSLAYRIAYRAADRTLTDEEVNRVHEELKTTLSRMLPVEPR